MEVIRVIRNLEMEEDVLLMSLNLNAVNQMNDIAPELTIGSVSSAVTGDLSLLPVQILAIARQAVSADLIRSSQEEGMNVFVWTVNRVEGMAEIMEMGADGIITDLPGLAVQAAQEMEKLTAAERMLLRFSPFKEVR